MFSKIQKFFPERMFVNSSLNSNKTFPSIQNQLGMTLLEIMIVLAILGGLITILAGQVTGKLDSAKVKEAKIQISELGKSLDMFYTDCGSYPETLNGLLEQPSNCSNWGPEPYLKKLQKDPWGSDFEYESDGATYNILSYGKDRKPGGTGSAKDINSEEL